MELKVTPGPAAGGQRAAAAVTMALEMSCPARASALLFHCLFCYRKLCWRVDFVGSLSPCC